VHRQHHLLHLNPNRRFDRIRYRRWSRHALPSSIQGTLPPPPPPFPLHSLFNLTLPPPPPSSGSSSAA
ncbi:hypothetical protein H0H93_003340, partial [Arthromyces matolae]